MEMTEFQEIDIKPNIKEIKLSIPEQLPSLLLENRQKKSNTKSDSQQTKKDKQDCPTKSKTVVSSDISYGICSNCNNEFRSPEDICLETAADEASESVSNSKALVYVYESKGKDFALVGHVQSVFLRNENSHFAMCRKCSSSLTKLYKALKQFSELCHLQSSIAQKLAELETLQATIYQDSLKAKQSDKTKDFIEDFCDVKVEPIDVFYENNDEDDFVTAGHNSDASEYMHDSDENNGKLKKEIRLRPESSRPKRNVRQADYSDYVNSISNTDSEDDSANSDSGDEDFKPPIKTNINKLKTVIKAYPQERTTSSDFELLNENDSNFNLSSDQCDNDPSLNDTYGSKKNNSRIKTKTKADGGTPNKLEGAGSTGSSISKRRTFKEGEANTCPHCSKTFVDPWNLKKHMRVHTDQDNDKLTCKKCSKKFTREHHLSRHMINVHSITNEQRIVARKKHKDAKEKYEVEKSRKEEKSKTVKRGDKFKEGDSDTCPHCSKVFLNPRSKRRHMRVHTDEDNDKLTCTVCLKKFTREHHMARHMITVHKASPPKPEPKLKKESYENKILAREYKCPVCAEEIKCKRSEFQEHVQSHNIKCPYKCSLCDSAFSGSAHLKQHMVRTHKKGKIEFICQVCNAEFGYNYLLLSHQRTQHSVPNNISLDTLEMLESVGHKNNPGKEEEQDINRLQCSLCEKRYSRKERLSLHMLSHTKDAPYSCEVCSKRFLQKRSLMRHMILHNDKNPYCCKICVRYFTRSDHLKRHMETAHHSGKPAAKEVECDVCGKHIRHQYLLKLHKLTHTNERPWTCDICGKGFNHPSTVMAHKKIHSDERKYCCSVCGKTFKRAGQLREHEGLHLEVVPKPYVCPVQNCGKAFRKNSHLTNHAVTHTSEKSFVCELCGAAFNRRDNLRVHHRAVHLNDPAAKRSKRPPKKIVPEYIEPPHYDFFTGYN